ncbi:auxin-responsive protein IAA11-like isoform X1 [Salvia hispanica]|uniref:auxin-responsive protein IAA11-like isoform X1 n=1 Tax=Salvia hispanica TaxID=49212 RepID=UPI0020096A83|nr:auxin-responsive protein IAA11-like isoform X1 [Salvia hispanica]
MQIDLYNMSSKESYDESELELGLGLSLGGANTKPNQPAPSSSSSSSSSSITKLNPTGTKRTADFPCSPPARSAISSQVVGWPPVRTYRLNSLSNHAKSPVTEELFSISDKCDGKCTDNSNNNNSKEKGFVKTSLFVKAKMDGVAIGRKVDLNAHSCYETLASALDAMFIPSASVGARGSNMEEHASVAGKRQHVRFLDGSSDFVLTYEDKDGDWMLVGDVPWEIFLNSVRRLRIMRTTDAKGLAPGSQERNGRRPITPL